jgi:hypothetical protein
VDVRAPHGHLDLDSPAVQPVGALAGDLHGRSRGDRQLHLAAKLVERRFELVGRGR